MLQQQQQKKKKKKKKKRALVTHLILSEMNHPRRQKTLLIYPSPAQEWKVFRIWRAWDWEAEAGFLYVKLIVL
ncbi:hypothetical protein AA0112_g9470 [Alternaria arborescens]|nr:hypothetical protein AA0112_g9470 [Alternaria arborescens]